MNFNERFSMLFLQRKNRTSGTFIYVPKKNISQHKTLKLKILIKIFIYSFKQEKRNQVFFLIK
jgi:hypothetical protein